MVKRDSAIIKRCNNQNDAIYMWRDSSICIVTSRKEGIRFPERILVRHSCGIHEKLSPLHTVYAELFPRGKVDGM